MSETPRFENEFRFVFFPPLDQYEAVISFYRDTLHLPVLGGFGASPDEMRGTYIQAAKGVLEIVADPTNSAFRQQAFSTGERYEPAHGGYLLIEVPNVEELYQQVSVQGVEIQQSMQDWPWGFRDFKVIDPAGNMVCLFSRR